VGPRPPRRLICVFFFFPTHPIPGPRLIGEIIPPPPPSPQIPVPPPSFPFCFFFGGGGGKIWCCWFPPPPPAEKGPPGRPGGVLKPGFLPPPPGRAPPGAGYGPARSKYFISPVPPPRLTKTKSQAPCNKNRPPLKAILAVHTAPPQIVPLCAQVWGHHPRPKEKNRAVGVGGACWGGPPDNFFFVFFFFFPSPPPGFPPPLKKKKSPLQVTTPITNSRPMQCGLFQRTPWGGAVNIPRPFSPSFFCVLSCCLLFGAPRQWCQKSPYVLPPRPLTLNCSRPPVRGAPRWGGGREPQN